MTIIIIYIACNRGGRGTGCAKPVPLAWRKLMIDAVVIAKSLSHGDDAMW